MKFTVDNSIECGSISRSGLIDNLLCTSVDGWNLNLWNKNFINVTQKISNMLIIRNIIEAQSLKIL